MKLPIEKLKGSFAEYPDTEDFVIEEVEARSLIDYRRLDFAAKLLYIDHYVSGLDMEYSTSIYKAQLAAITGNTNIERGNEKKNSLEAFLTTFNSLINDIRDNGFDSTKSLIPVDASGYVIDGAHRLTAAAYFNKKVSILRFNTWKIGLSTDYKFFQSNFLKEEAFDAMALEFCNWRADLYMACVWSQTLNYPDIRNQAIDYIGKKTNIVYRKTVELSSSALRNLCMQIYGHMDWIGSINNHFSGVDAKVKEIYDSKHNTVEFILMQSDTFQTVFDMKQEVRKIFNIGLSSIHTTDNIRETRQIADLIFNPNSLHHLRNSIPDRFEKSYRLFLNYKAAIQKCGHDWRDYVLDSSMVMALYGIREAGDLDYLTTNTDSSAVSLHSMSPGDMECNDKYVIYHCIPVKDMIMNPSHFFVFNEIKFLTLKEISIFKTNKGEPKDKNDVRMISAYISKSFKSKITYKFLEYKRVYKIKITLLNYVLRNRIICLLQALGLLGLVKALYHKLRR